MPDIQLNDADLVELKANLQRWAFANIVIEDGGLDNLQNTEYEKIMKPNKTKFKVKAVDGEMYYPEELCLHKDTYYPLTHKDVFKCLIDNDYHHISNSVNVITDIIVNEPNSSILKYGKVNRIFIDDLICVYSNKYDFNGYIISLDTLKNTNWKYGEGLESHSIVDYEIYKADKRILHHISKYYTFKNYINSKGLSLSDAFKYGAKSPSYLISEGIKMSFGVELEVSKGNVPIWRKKDFNISAVRDGSLNKGDGGLEIVTGVLTGDTGFKHLQEICNYLASRCLVDKYCGMHLHLGGIDFSNKFLINSYKLFSILEPSIFKILPNSRRNNDYCRKLKKFNFDIVNDPKSLKAKEDFIKLFKYISYERVNNPNFEYNKTKQHPMGAKCGYNHDTPRYCWVNYVPAMFNTRGNGSYSIEIRNHQGTLNFKKVKNWILLFMGIVHFIDNYPDLITDDVTLEFIINKVYPKTGSSLINYINERRMTFNSSTDRLIAEETEKSEYINDIKDESLENLSLKKLLCV